MRDAGSALPLWTAPVRVCVYLFAVFRDSSLNLSVRNGKNRFHDVLEPLERFRPLVHFGFTHYSRSLFNCLEFTSRVLFKNSIEIVNSFVVLNHKG